MPTFGKKERLCDKRYIYLLHNNGKFFDFKPFSVEYLFIDDENMPALSVLISIPKRNIKKATRRNKLKRWIKEAYRNNKSNLCSLLEKQNKRMLLKLSYNGAFSTNSEENNYAIIEAKIKLILQRLSSVVS